MKEKIKQTLKQRKIDEQNLLKDIANLKNALSHREATLISTKGGIIELELLLQSEEKLIPVEEEE